MKKLLKKVLISKREKIPVQDPVQVLIARLCDPLDPIYDAEFVKGMNETNPFNTK
jgi:hypothetical protein